MIRRPDRTPCPQSLLWAVFVALSLSCLRPTASVAAANEPLPPLPQEVIVWDQQSMELATQGVTWQQLLSEHRRTASELDLQQQQQDDDASAAPQLKAAIEETNEQITRLVGQIEELQRLQRQLAQQTEAALRRSGQWVSFTDQIAPLLQRSCVVCHNPRQSHGRYNLVSYAALLVAGDSGEAIVPGDPDQSLLLQLIEDGSMPVDGEPFSDDEIQLVRRWIHSGARIETDADSHAPLARLVPRPAQPAAPLVYPVAPPVTAIAWSPDGQRLASSGYHEVLIWQLGEGEAAPELVARWDDLPERVLGLDFDPQGNRLAVASGTPGRWGEVRLLDANSGVCLADLCTADDCFRDVVFSPDGHRIAAAASDGSIVILTEQSADSDSQSQTHWSLGRLEFHSDWVTSVNWSDDGQLLVSSSRDKTNKVFDWQQRRPLVTFTAHEQMPIGAYFAADGKQLISGGEDRKVRRWTLADAKQQKHITTASSPLSGLIAWGDNQVLSISADRRVRIHDLESGESLASLETAEAWLTALRASPDGQRIAFGSHAGTISIAAPTTEKLNLQWHWTAAPQQP